MLAYVDPGTGSYFFQLALAVIPIALFVLLAAALIDALRRTFPEPNGKLLWVLVIILLPCLGPILWFTVGRKQSTA